MGIDMGIYYAHEVPPLVPDGFLSDRRHRRRRQLLEVHRLVDGEYVLQEGDRNLDA